MNDDDLERRLRGALTRPRPGDAVDTDDFLSRVHHGAKVRRVKRGVSVAAVSVLAVTGGGLAINATDLLGGSETPVAGQHTTPSSGPGTGSTAKDPVTTTPSQSKQSQETLIGPESVTISPNGPIAASEVHAVSLSATGTDHQWVLAKTPGDDCGRPECATLFATADHGANWSDVGQLPAPPATVDTAVPETVSQLRFTKRTDGSEIYDGWAFGGALWSTHDSGRSWSAAGAPAGNVTQLESWGDYVYAGVSSPVAGDDTAILYRSPTTEDSWTPVEVSPKGIDGLTSVQSLAASKDVVALIDSGGLHSPVYVSTDGETWQREYPCPKGTEASDLSTASDASKAVGSLWLTCRGPSQSVILLTDTTNLGTWSTVPDDSFPPTVSVAAQSPTLAFVAGDGVPGIQRVSTTEPATTVAAPGVGPPILFGFTNVAYGYLLDAEGNIVSTTNGGGQWLPYTVSDTP
jgi:hypothetical protein